MGCTPTKGTVKPDDNHPKSSSEQLSATASAVTVQPSPVIAASAVTVQPSPIIAADAVSRQLVVVRPNDNTVQPAKTARHPATANASASSPGGDSDDSIFLRLLIAKSDINVGIKCAGCNETDFIGYRFKCCLCKNYDLCADCFESRKFSPQHSPAHLMYFIRSPLTPEDNKVLSVVFNMGPNAICNMFKLSVHEGIACAVCNRNPIRRIRVKCDDCVDYDMCWQCYSTYKVSNTHTLQHAVVAHLVPMRRQFDLEKDIIYENRRLGRGTFGSVEKVRYSGQPCALKTIRIDGSPKDLLRFVTFHNEILAYSEIYSNQIIKYYGYAVEREVNCINLHLLTEFMESGTLSDIISRRAPVSLSHKLHWIHSIIKGIRRMHAKGFVHKDIKPANILINARKDVKLGDMGIATHDQGREYFSGQIGPVMYTAPEVFTQPRYDKKVDIFSFGLVVYELFTYRQRIMNTFYDVLKPVVFPMPSAMFMPLIRMCVSMDPDERLSAAEIEDKLSALNTGFWLVIKEKNINYHSMSIEQRDIIFTAYYSALLSAAVL